MNTRIDIEVLHENIAQSAKITSANVAETARLREEVAQICCSAGWPAAIAGAVFVCAVIFAMWWHIGVA